MPIFVLLARHCTDVNKNFLSRARTWTWDPIPWLSVSNHKTKILDLRQDQGCLSHITRRRSWTRDKTKAVCLISQDEDLGPETRPRLSVSNHKTKTLDPRQDQGCLSHITRPRSWTRDKTMAVCLISQDQLQTLWCPDSNTSVSWHYHYDILILVVRCHCVVSVSIQQSDWRSGLLSLEECLQHSESLVLVRRVYRGSVLCQHYAMHSGASLSL